MKQPAAIAVFMDRDGTINEEVGYVNHLERFKLLPQTAAAIRILNEKGIKAVVITNQAGAARGYFPREFIDIVHQKMEQLLAQKGVYLDGIYYCAHHPEERCACRKPATGLLKRAAKELKLELRKSYLVGDKFSDLEMAQRVGIKGIMVLSGYGKGELEFFKDRSKVKPDYIAGNLFRAVKWIIKDIKKT